MELKNRLEPSTPPSSNNEWQLVAAFSIPLISTIISQLIAACGITSPSLISVNQWQLQLALRTPLPPSPPSSSSEQEVAAAPYIPLICAIIWQLMAASGFLSPSFISANLWQLLLALRNTRLPSSPQSFGSSRQLSVAPYIPLISTRSCRQQPGKFGNCVRGGYARSCCLLPLVAILFRIQKCMCKQLSTMQQYNQKQLRGI